MAYGNRNTPTAVNDGGSRKREEERQVLDLGKLILDNRKEPATPRQDPRQNVQEWTPRSQESSEESPSILEGLVQSQPAWTAPQQQEEPAPAPQEPINEQPSSAPVSTPINTGRLGPSLLTEPLAEPVTEGQEEKNPSPSDFLTPYRNQPKPQNPVTEKKDDAPLTNSIMYQDWKNLINSGTGSGAGSAEIPFSGSAPQQDVSVLGNGYVRPLPYANMVRNNITDPAIQLGRDVSELLIPTAFSGYNRPVNISVPVSPNNAGPMPAIPVVPNNAGPLPRTPITPNNAGPLPVTPNNAGLIPQRMNPPVLSGNDPMEQFSDLFESQPSTSGSERLNPSISDFDMQNELERLASPTGRGPIDYIDVTRNIGSRPPTLEDPQWLQNMTGGNSLAGLVADTAGNALDSILRIGSGGPVTPQPDIPLDPAGDWLLGQMIGEANVAPAVSLANSIAQNPTVRNIGDYMLDQQFGKANADRLRAQWAGETTPTTIMNQPAPAASSEPQSANNTPTATEPRTPSAPINTGSSQPSVFNNVENWFRDQFGNNLPYGNSLDVSSIMEQPPAASATPPNTNIPTTGGAEPYQSTNRYNPDSSAYYNRKFDDIMMNTDNVSGETARQILNSPITVNKDFADLIASDFAYDARTPKAEQVEMTQDQFKKEFNSFVNANPDIKSMMENRQLSAEDIINLYFKDVVEPGTGTGSGSGNGSGTGNGKDKSGYQTLQPSYGQEKSVVKAPYKAGGYSEDELKKMGNVPYKDYRGNNAYEGYYYWDGKWYPVNQDKANYYNTYGTYNGYTDDMGDYYRTFGTYYGYRPGWRTAGRSGGYSSRSYSYGGGGGGSYGSSSSPSTKTQERDVQYNIMKNWSF